MKILLQNCNCAFLVQKISATLSRKSKVQIIDCNTGNQAECEILRKSLLLDIIIYHEAENQVSRYDKSGCYDV